MVNYSITGNMQDICRRTKWMNGVVVVPYTGAPEGVLGLWLFTLWRCKFYDLLGQLGRVSHDNVVKVTEWALWSVCVDFLGDYTYKIMSFYTSEVKENY